MIERPSPLQVGTHLRELAGRLDYAVKLLGGAEEAAAATGKSATQIRRYLKTNDPTPAPVDFIMALANAAGVTTSYLLEGVSAAREYIALPYCEEASSVQGAPAPAPPIAFNREWLRSAVGVGDCCLWLSGNNAMAPAVQKGDLVLIHRIDQLKHEDIYLFDIQGSLLLRYVTRKFNGGYRLTTSASNDVLELGPDALDTQTARVIGRVMHVWR